LSRERTHFPEAGDRVFERGGPAEGAPLLVLIEKQSLAFVLLAALGRRVTEDSDSGMQFGPAVAEADLARLVAAVDREDAGDLADAGLERRENLVAGLPSSPDRFPSGG